MEDLRCRTSDAGAISERSMTSIVAGQTAMLADRHSDGVGDQQAGGSKQPTALGCLVNNDRASHPLGGFAGTGEEDESHEGGRNGPQ